MSLKKTEFIIMDLSVTPVDIPSNTEVAPVVKRTRRKFANDEERKEARRAYYKEKRRLKALEEGRVIKQHRPYVRDNTTDLKTKRAMWIKANPDLVRQYKRNYYHKVIKHRKLLELIKENIIPPDMVELLKRHDIL